MGSPGGQWAPSSRLLLSPRPAAGPDPNLAGPNLEMIRANALMRGPAENNGTTNNNNNNNDNNRQTTATGTMRPTLELFELRKELELA